MCLGVCFSLMKRGPVQFPYALQWFLENLTFVMFISVRPCVSLCSEHIPLAFHSKLVSLRKNRDLTGANRISEIKAIMTIHKLNVNWIICAQSLKLLSVLFINLYTTIQNFGISMNFSLMIFDQIYSKKKTIKLSNIITFKIFYLNIF